MKKKQQALIKAYLESPSEQLKAEISQIFEPLVAYIARKLAFNRDDFEDLVQIGNIALLRCLDRYSLDRNTDFATFATPNIIGEIRHYFRDKNKLIKVPRRLQELHSKIRQLVRKLQNDGVRPTLSELSKSLEVSEELILEAMEAGQNSKTVSLDTPVFSGDSFVETGSAQHMVNKIGVTSKEESFLNKETLKDAIYKLSDRERRIIYLRFYGGLSQAQIATRLGLSQMHISRLITQSITRLRGIITEVPQ
eukprot:COSAG01_NODE_9_length_43729_cov_66.133463_27_plen_251_part_00